MRGPRLPPALSAGVLYAVVAVAVTWPLAPRMARDLPGDLLDPLFTCWALAWNLHAFGLSEGGVPVASYWDANIFHPTPMALARSEHFLPQALQGAPVYALTHGVVLTYNVLFLSTFVLSGLFFFRLARDETGDAGAALGAGLLYGFALFRWAQVGHLGALSSQWMPLCLLLARRTARAQGAGAAFRVLALAGATALQVLSSGYYLLFFPPLLALWAALQAKTAGGIGPWLRLVAAGGLAAAVALPMVLPYVALRSGGAERDLASVMAHSADLLSFASAPAITTVWGGVLRGFPRGEARLFPGVVTPLLALVGLVAAVKAARAAVPAAHPGDLPPRVQRLARIAAILLAAAGLLGAVLALAGAAVTFGPWRVRTVTPTRPVLWLTLAVIAAIAGWSHFNTLTRAVLSQRAVAAVLLSVLAAALALGPLVTVGGWPAPLPAPYRLLYDFVPGFESGRAPARFAMIAACFAALAAAHGLAHLRTTAGGRKVAWVACALFVVETAAVPLPLSRQWDVEGIEALPAWHGGAPSPIVAAIRGLPEHAVLAVLPFGEIFHETRAMYDSAHHWRRLLNGYSSWTPDAHTRLALAVRDPLRHAPETVAALRAAGATHVVVHEAAWSRDKGPRVTERLAEAGARTVARAGDVTLLALR